MKQHREYFYTINNRGELIHDGCILDEPDFLDFFFRRIQPNTTGLNTDYRYYSPCGVEWNYIACADTPIVFTRLHNNELYYAPSLCIEFSPRDLRFSDDGVLYHRAPIGQWGRIAAHVVTELSACIEPWGEWFIFHHVDDVPEVIPPLTLPANKSLMRPREGNACAGCGRDNPDGLYLTFIVDTETGVAESWLVPSARFMGSLGVMHGGYTALLLDETMGKVLSGKQRKAPTAQLNVRYRKPISLGRELYLRGEILREEGRKNFLRGTISYSSEPEIILAEAEALFLTIRSSAQSS